jgi:hypothetical protein
MRTALILFMLTMSIMAFGQDAAPPADPATSTPPTDASISAIPAETPAETSVATPAAIDAPPLPEAEELKLQITKLEEEYALAGAEIERLKAEAGDLAARAEAAAAQSLEDQRIAAEAGAAAKEAESRAASATGAAKTSEERAKAAEAGAESAATALVAANLAATTAAAEASGLRGQIAGLEARIKALEAEKASISAKLIAWGSLRLLSADFPELVYSGFSGGVKRIGSWTLDGSVLYQTDPGQYFSRLSIPLAQTAKPTLYSFETKTGLKGWAGTGLHFFANDVKKPRGYGEGKSLLVWLTRDEKVRGGTATWLQIYRSDDDVAMERVLDAKLQEPLTDWLRVDILYDPLAEFVVIAVGGQVKAAYRTFFGIGAGMSLSFRTLGAGVAFRNFEVRR